LCRRLLLNPGIAALLEYGSEIAPEAPADALRLFTAQTSNGASAPLIQVNRKLAQLLEPNTPRETDKIVLNVGELFSGAGGFGLGFILAQHPLVRYHPLFAIDNDPSSVETYKQNAAWLAQHAPDVLDHPVSTFRRDVRKLRVPAVLRWAKLNPCDLDLLIGGPPCQGFSTSNKTANVEYKLANNALVNVFLDVVSAFRPKMFLMENVQGVRWTAPSDDMTIASADGTSDVQRFKTVREFLRAKARSLGYLIWDGILDAADFGVPQHRLRYFLFGIRRDLLSAHLEQISLDPYLQQYQAAQHVTVEQAIGDLPPLENGQVWNDGRYEPGQNSYIQRMRRFLADGELFDHYTTLHQGYVIDRFREIPEGRNWEAIREQMTTYNSETIDNTHRNIYRRLRRDMPANTISHYRKSMVIHPSEDRGLSFREACRLQSFPDWFRFSGIRGAQQQQLANAVPPLMAVSVAYAIAELFLDETNRKRLVERL
jgi:DNA-cytosine methyltransferase